MTVMGLGLHGGGVGIAKWLMRHGAFVTVTDLKNRNELAGSVAELGRAHLKEVRRYGKGCAHRIRYVLGRHDVKDFTGADMVVKNPAVPRGNVYIDAARKKKVPIETDISVFFMLCPVPVSAVTGTKGKTTAVSLLGAICARHDRRTVVGGNIRVSPMDFLDRLVRGARGSLYVPAPVVLELSSWQLEGLRKYRRSPHIAVVTNLKQDHLNRYRGMEDYIRAKEGIIAFQKEGDVAVLNADDAKVRGMSRKSRSRARRFWFSEKRLKRGLDGCFISGGKVVIRDRGKVTALFPGSVIRIPGAHNVSNVLAASAAAWAAGVSARDIRAAVREFRGVSGRMEAVRTLRGVKYVNDTTATTPDASVAAMKTFSAGGKNIILIAGGADKKLVFNEWSLEVCRRVKHMVLFDGTATTKMERSIKRACPRLPVSYAASMPDAMKLAAGSAKRGDVVLLSPGCASFGMFVNEFDRGDRFTAAVKRLR